MIQKSHLRIEYLVSKRDKRHLQDELPKAERFAEAGRYRSAHLHAIFVLLSAADLTRLTDGVGGYSLTEASDALNSIGELGAHLSDSLYCDISELEDCHDEQAKAAEDATTFIES